MFQKNLQMFGGKPTSIDTDKKIGTPIKTGLSDEETVILKKLIELTENGSINIFDPESIFNEKFSKLPEDEQEKISQKASTLTNLIRHIIHHYKSKEIETENMTMQNMLQTVIREKTLLKDYLKF